MDLHHRRQGHSFVEKPDLTYTKAVAECDVAHDAGLKVDTAYTLIVNGQTASTKYTVNLTDTKTTMGAQGRLFEVYDDTIVMIDTFLAKVTKVTAASTDRNGHVTDATVDRKVYQVNDTGIDKAGVEAEGFTVGQYVLVTMTVDTASPVVQAVEAAAVTPMGQLKNWSYAYGTTAATTTLADTSTTMLTSSMAVTSRVPPTLLPLGIPSLTLMAT